MFALFKKRVENVFYYFSKLIENEFKTKPEYKIMIENFLNFLYINLPKIWSHLFNTLF